MEIVVSILILIERNETKKKQTKNILTSQRAVFGQENDINKNGSTKDIFRIDKSLFQNFRKKIPVVKSVQSLLQRRVPILYYRAINNQPLKTDRPLQILFSDLEI